MLTLTEHRQNIEYLIAQNRIEEAREYCLALDHSIAALWLADIDQLFPSKKVYGVSQPYFDGELAPEHLAVLDLPLVEADSDVPFKRKNEPDSIVGSLTGWLGCFSFYVGAMVFFTLLYFGTLILVYYIVHAV